MGKQPSYGHLNILDHTSRMFHHNFLWLVPLAKFDVLLIPKVPIFSTWPHENHPKHVMACHQMSIKFLCFFSPMVRTFMGYHGVPSGSLTQPLNMAIYNDFFHEKLWCSMALLNYQKVFNDVSYMIIMIPIVEGSLHGNLPILTPNSGASHLQKLFLHLLLSLFTGLCCEELWQFPRQWRKGGVQALRSWWVDTLW